MLRSYDKKALSYEEQTELLRRRGLEFADQARATETLARIGYYRLSAYWHPFKKADDRFEQGATFEAALGLYEYDRRLRLLVLDAMERVEITVRTRLTYVLGHAYGAFAHVRPSNFRPEWAANGHKDWYERLEEEIERSKETFVIHYRNTYEGFPRIPIWMASEVMSLGSLSHLFKGMKTADRTMAVSGLGAHHSVVESWLHTLTYVRNICAHHARLWNRELGVRPKLPSGEPKWRPVRSGRIYSVLCILRCLTSEHHAGDDWAAQAVAWLREMEGRTRWQDAMGVARDWDGHAFWRDIAGSSA